MTKMAHAKSKHAMYQQKLNDELKHHVSRRVEIRAYTVLVIGLVLFILPLLFRAIPEKNAPALSLFGALLASAGAMRIIIHR